MGYTHYWERPERLDPEKFTKAAGDVRLVLKKLKELGLELAGPDGEGMPIIGDSVIAFNGKRQCGHQRRDLGITWPSPSNDTGGIGSAVKGKWFAGALLMERTCDGDCSHESFWLEVNETMPDYQKKDGKNLIFNFTKTAYKPYDLAVTAVLVILKHHFGDKILVRSDGDLKDWRDGSMYCQMVLGYGSRFTLDERG